LSSKADCLGWLDWSHRRTLAGSSRFVDALFLLSDVMVVELEFVVGLWLQSSTTV